MNQHRYKMYFSLWNVLGEDDKEFTTVGNFKIPPDQIIVVAEKMIQNVNGNYEPTGTVDRKCWTNRYEFKGINVNEKLCKKCYAIWNEKIIYHHNETIEKPLPHNPTEGCFFYPTYNMAEDEIKS